MFKQLKNEALVRFDIEVDTPLVIRSGETNILDPSLPEDQVVKQYRNGKLEPVIPGSSLKGVFRSRAEKLLRSMGYQVDNPFRQITPEEQKSSNKKTAEQLYKESCPATKIFGNQLLKSRVAFADAYIKDGCEYKFGTRHGVAIDRITGGSKDKKKFDYEVVEDGTFSASFTLTNFELWQLKILLWMLKEMDEGYIKLGSATSRGFGKVYVPNVTVKIISYTGQKETDAIYGYYREKDRTAQQVQWQKDFIGHYFEKETLESWIGEDGLLENIAMP